MIVQQTTEEKRRREEALAQHKQDAIAKSRRSAEKVGGRLHSNEDLLLRMSAAEEKSKRVKALEQNLASQNERVKLALEKRVERAQKQQQQERKEQEQQHKQDKRRTEKERKEKHSFFLKALAAEQEAAEEKHKAVLLPCEEPHLPYKLSAEGVLGNDGSALGLTTEKDVHFRYLQRLCYRVLVEKYTTWSEEQLQQVCEEVIGAVYLAALPEIGKRARLYLCPCYSEDGTPRGVRRVFLSSLPATVEEAQGIATVLRFEVLREGALRKVGAPKPGDLIIALEPIEVDSALAAAKRAIRREARYLVGSKFWQRTYLVAAPAAGGGALDSLAEPHPSAEEEAERRGQMNVLRFWLKALSSTEKRAVSRSFSAPAKVGAADRVALYRARVALKKRLLAEEAKQ